MTNVLNNTKSLTITLIAAVALFFTLAAVTAITIADPGYLASDPREIEIEPDQASNPDNDGTPWVDDSNGSPWVDDDGDGIAGIPWIQIDDIKASNPNGDDDDGTPWLDDDNGSPWIDDDGDGIAGTPWLDDDGASASVPDGDIVGGTEGAMVRLPQPEPDKGRRGG